MWDCRLYKSVVKIINQLLLPAVLVFWSDLRSLYRHLHWFSVWLFENFCFCCNVMQLSLLFSVSLHSVCVLWFSLACLMKPLVEPAAQLCVVNRFCTQSHSQLFRQHFYCCKLKGWAHLTVVKKNNILGPCFSAHIKMQFGEGSLVGAPFSTGDHSQPHRRTHAKNTPTAILPCEIHANISILALQS